MTQAKLTNFAHPDKTLSLSALVDTSAAYITLPNAWRENLGEIEPLGEIEVEMGDQSTRKGLICGPLRAQIGQFRPIIAEVLFPHMQPDEGGEYGPLVGYIALKQAGAAVDMLGQRLVHVRRADSKREPTRPRRPPAARSRPGGHVRRGADEGQSRTADELLLLRKTSPPVRSRAA